MAAPQKIAIAAFVKTPGFSPVKTRIAKDIGLVAAEDFIRHGIRCTEDLMRALSRLEEPDAPYKVNAYWAVAEPAAMDHPLWQSFARISQGEGGLGRRMASVYEKLLQDRTAVLLIGADCPLLSVEHLHAACLALATGRSEHVLGPTEDGGFYLFGSKAKFQLSQWEDVPYSQADTLERFRASMGLRDEAVTWLPRLYDVDTVEDFKRFQGG